MSLAQLERALNQTRVLSDAIRLSGGLDEITPPYQRAPGLLRVTQNFEVSINGGYRRIPGYERVDGRAKPSDATYAILNVTITGSFAVNNTVTGATSLATAKVLAVVTSVSPNYLVLSKITGTFQNPETLTVSAVPQGTTSSLARIGAASTPLLNAQYKALAADLYRADIGAVPGSGYVRGVFMLNDVEYAFRNNAGGTAVALYKSSGSGWTAVSLNEQISFTNANTGVNDGDTLTQGAVTATVLRVVLKTGSFASGVNTGKLIINARAGGNFGAGAATSTGAGALTLSGAQTAITLLPDGRFMFVRENFSGAANGVKIYGCDKVNKGFEFDGTVFVPIDTGMTADAPNQVHVHKQQLLFSFDASVQHSAPTTPYVWSPIFGAAEIGMGDTVTGFSTQPGSGGGGALAIFTRNKLSVLYGSGVADWNLVAYRNELGAYAYTIQDVGHTMFLDDRGVTDMQTSQRYGNFAHNALTNQIRNRMNEYRLLSTASCISRDRSQYRIFFSNNYAFYITVVGAKTIGIMPVLFSHTVRCTWSGEKLDGSEVMYFGSDDGYVYQMDRGTSFDGSSIEFFFDLAYNFQGSPRVNKRYRGLTLEIEGSGYTTFNVGHVLGYTSTAIPQPLAQSITTNFASSSWDAFTWDMFFWDGITLLPNTITLDGEGENISVGVRGGADYFEPFTITAALIHYTPRGRLRP